MNEVRPGKQKSWFGMRPTREWSVEGEWSVELIVTYESQKPWLVLVGALNCEPKREVLIAPKKNYELFDQFHSPNELGMQAPTSISIQLLYNIIIPCRKWGLSIELDRTNQIIRWEKMDRNIRNPNIRQLEFLDFSPISMRYMFNHLIKFIEL